MEKQNRSKYLFKNTIIFTIGNLATKVISFFLIPLYTNVLTTSEYGTVDLVVTISTIAVPIITLNIMEAVMRFNLDRGVDKNKITKIGIVILFFGMLLGLALIPLCRLWNQVSSFSILVYFYVVCSASSQVFLCDLRGKELLVQYSIGNILNTLLIAGFNILFLLGFKFGIAGYLLAYTIANAIVAVYALIIGKGYRAIRAPLDKRKIKEMLKYSVVLIPNSFMWWIMNSSDHVMVTSMIGVAANGVYAISYKLPTLISTFTGIFNQAWSYSAIREEDAEDVETYTNNVFKSMISVIMLIGLCMMAVIKPFLKIYVSPKYYEAWQYTPFLIIGCVYLTLGTFMSTSYTVHKDSKGFLLSGTFGAILNIALNFTLIPNFGVYGAAFATCISYISVFIFRVFHTKKYMYYNVLTRELIIGSIALICSATLMFADNSFAQILQIIILVMIIYIFKNIWLPFGRKIFMRFAKEKR
ncbi:flippase [Bariatricus sp. HCP28S3_D3]|uniref:flippase n=1 Tax=Bariatricus sp. HCP28S3_D3 TaxID=3438901 RepID=UPI003F8A0B73